MPTPYTANPTATQAPSAAPGPGVLPIANLPIDTDPPNAATWAQAFKVLADFVGWLMKPFAVVASWVQPIFWWRNAILQRRFAIDHLGFPAGKIIAWQDNFDDVSLTLKNAIANGNWGGRWAYSIAGAAAGTVSAGTVALFGGNNTGGAFLETATTGVTPNASHIEKASLIAVPAAADAVLAMQWDSPYLDGNVAITEFDMGVYAGATLLGVGTNFSLGTTPAAAFIKRPADTNWFAYTRPFGGAATITDTGVAAGSNSRRFRMEIVGTNTSDDSTPRVLFYIDGALVVNRALAADWDGGFVPFFRASTTAVKSELIVTALDVRANLHGGDIVA